MTTEIVESKTPRTFSEDELANIGSFADAVSLINDTFGGDVARESISDYGSGFRLVDKSELVGVPFLILEWMFNEGDFSDDGFVTVYAVTNKDDRVIFNDGSTGVRDQLRTVTSQRVKNAHPNPQIGLACEGGLTVSNYYRHEDTGVISRRKPDGKGWIPAATYYLAG